MNDKLKIKSFSILDCTIRDGGYYNKWQFDKTLVKNMIMALSTSGVDIVELGYKAPVSHKAEGFEGLFRYCNESQLLFLKDCPVNFACMLDVKEFIREDQTVNFDLLETCIVERKNSLFQWVRLAVYNNYYSQAIEIGKKLKSSGYYVSINLMGISLLTEEDIKQTLTITTKDSLDVFYIADSYGNLMTNDIVKLITLIRKHYSGKIGIHTHDNMGLAFANTITAIENGVDYIDSSIIGMGRGAGNLKTEQILLYSFLKLKEEKRNPYNLMDIIDSYFLNLHKQYRWGWDYTYMLSALQNIHPAYCQELRSGNQYSKEQVSFIFNELESSKKSAYNKESLLKAINHAIHFPVSKDKILKDLPAYKPSSRDKIIVVGKGKTSSQYKDEIKDFIKQNNVLVIECHPSDDSFKSLTDKYLGIALNWRRLKMMLDNNEGLDYPIITGVDKIPDCYSNKANIFKVNCNIDKTKISIACDSITLPAYMVGMFAIGIAALSQPKTIYLTGFDGYNQDITSLHKEMSVFLEFMQKENHELISLTETSYPIPCKSIFNFLK